MLVLVDRVIVFAQQRIVMDGPRDQVLQKLMEKPAAPEPAAQSRAPSPAPVFGGLSVGQRRVA
jgi:hypothetical protein